MQLPDNHREKIIKAAHDAARAVGVDVYDLDIPKYSGGVLRIDLWRADEPLDANGRRRGVLLDQCAEVSKHFDAAIEGFGIYDEDFTIEVGSPGLNRTLRTLEQFSSAIGEKADVVLSEGVTLPGSSTPVKRFTATVQSVSGQSGTGQSGTGQSAKPVQDDSQGDSEKIIFLFNQPVKKAKQKRSPSARGSATAEAPTGARVVSILLSNIREASVHYDFNAAGSADVSEVEVADNIEEAGS